jgi:hypothetical protein
MSMPRGRVQRISGGLFFDDEYSYSEYQAHGMIFHQFDYWWDYIAQNTFPQVRQLYPDATAALLTSAFANAVKIYQKANYAGIVEFSFKATGLAGAFFAGPRRTHLDIAHLAESEVELKRAFTVEQLASSVLETAMDCQRELYWAFGFDAPDKWIIEDFQSR